MKLNRFFSAVLSAALLINLCACNSIGPASEYPRPSTRVTSRPSHTSKPSETPAASPEFSTSPAPTPTPATPYDKNHRLNASIPELIDGLEMPIAGATGYTSVSLPVWPSNPNRSAQASASAVSVWEPGVAFLILEEDGDWWRVSRGNETGWIEHRYCMINLPDVIPSILYDDANAYSSLFISCGKNIPGVTGEVFYHSLVYNVRLNRQEFVMPILYSAARNICAAQHRALAEGNCLRVYQTFRPYDTQMAVARAMTQLAKVDPEVNAGISTSPWSISWFIATSVSNHQRGYALDVTMVKVYKTETRSIGAYPYLYATDFEYYEMPTVMHELSIAAISTISPTSSQLSDTMNEPAIALRNYFISSGLSPLASEWWHFNDLAAMRSTENNPSDGKYFITECLSCIPELAARL